MKEAIFKPWNNKEQEKMGSDARPRRRPVEAIECRAQRSVECERRVRNALARLTKKGMPFTVEDVCDLAGVGKTFVYDKRRPLLTQAVILARDASQNSPTETAADELGAATASWRERAINAEALAKSLRKTLRDREDRISDLLGQLYDPQGNHLAEQNSELRRLMRTLHEKLRSGEEENTKLRRSLAAARANVQHERERNVTALTAGTSHF